MVVEVMVMAVEAVVEPTVAAPKQAYCLTGTPSPVFSFLLPLMVQI